MSSGGDRSDRDRFNYIATPAERERVARIQGLAGGRSITQVHRDALRLYERALETTAAGGAVVLRSAGGHEVEVLIL